MNTTLSITAIICLLAPAAWFIYQLMFNPEGLGLKTKKWVFGGISVSMNRCNFGFEEGLTVFFTLIGAIVGGAMAIGALIWLNEVLNSVITNETLCYHLTVSVPSLIVLAAVIRYVIWFVRNIRESFV